MSKRNIVHVEIPAADQTAAGTFYQQLFGWKITPIPEMNYIMWESSDAASCGNQAMLSPAADSPAFRKNSQRGK